MKSVTRLPVAHALSHFLLLICFVPLLVAPSTLLSVLISFAVLGTRSRQSKSVLSNPVRSEIIACIRANPGIPFSEIVREIGSNTGTVQYHLWVLRKEGYLIASRVDGQSGYFLPGQGYSMIEQQVMICLRNRTGRKILCLLIQRPGINQSRIAEILGLSRSAVAWHMKRMVSVVSSWQDGRSMCYALEPGAAAVLREEHAASSGGLPAFDHGSEDDHSTA
ncbi:winged helix-turn-helix transcriptional regulator [uncultured Methanofollis sp.]|uniref:winged helix-turn-helix transcriptional regulator n=1 Tax=uncultured Methanofollis sp. TaxID=262500 RepID=UPI00261A9C56|nr:winged helix-turn-helix transcriptional regulator [uncultured Methanofollis sp.]